MVVKGWERKEQHSGFPRSYVCRNSRVSSAQKRALAECWEQYGLPDNVAFDAQKVFGRKAPLSLEIGFGNGEHLLKQAIQFPEHDFIGIEVWLPGIGTLLRQAKDVGITNLRVVKADAALYISDYLPHACLNQVWILFPDPWPKRKHQKRRLITGEFLHLLALKTQINAKMYLSTDWAHYAQGILRLGLASPEFQVREHSEQRDVVTRFEQRGINLGQPAFNFVLWRKDNQSVPGTVPVSGLEPPTY